MIRTLVSLEPEDKAWLERTARAEGVPETELVRRAVRNLRRQQETSFSDLLRRTRGIWKKGDALAYQRRLRRQWR
jgi:hypothetical protein